ncbi:flagellar protein FlhE [Onishia niordana]|uniref:flagellar protein FlhE n=1 Tax=Onishia niordana TaxID=2508711 RepID=UPI00144807EC|nr:flagellar protein FlhE [Halomonas niordiana]
MSLFAAILLGIAPVCLSAGSWVANAPAVNVAVPGRVTNSEALKAIQSARLAGRQVRDVSWQFRLPPGKAVRAWLCQGSVCMQLTTQNGRRNAPASWQAGGAIHFRFLLPNGKRRAVRVDNLQIIVNYRSQTALPEK